MTVIDVFLDRQRPNLVEKDKISPGRDLISRKRKLSEDNQLIKEIQGCAVPKLDYSMEANASFPEPKNNGHPLSRDGEKVAEISSQPAKKQKLSIKSDKSPIRGRRKSRWKLKFHHQALPPEYLRHYKLQERKRRQSETKKQNQIKTKTRKIIKKSVSEKESNENNNKNNVEMTLEVPAKNDEMTPKREADELAETQRLNVSCSPLPKMESDRKTLEYQESSFSVARPELDIRCKSADELLSTNISNISQLNIDISQNKAFLENLLTNQIEINRVDRKVADSKNLFGNKTKTKPESKTYSIPSSGKIMKYSDLPYMGEITLDGIKPRRGRKPKKADICHLIYKNYGQVFPGAPGRDSETETNKKPIKWKPEVNSSQTTKASNTLSDSHAESPLPSVSSLINHTEVQNRIINSLLEKRLTQELKMKNSLSKIKDSENHDEPLNLCVRDLKSLKIKLSRKHGNIYETKNQEVVELKPDIEDTIKKEVISIDKTDSEDESDDEEDDLAPFNLVTTELRESSDEDGFLNFNDQITLTKIKSPEEKSVKEEPSEEPPSTSPVMYWPNNDVFLHPMSVQTPLLYYQRLSNEVPVKSNSNTSEKKQMKNKTLNKQNLKRIAPKVNPNAAHVITKRKRSAIFIPPVPAENTTNPTTEVSICKFKFTGGAKPSLQEKKMLSVDSGGNFRYYSGTGDKSMRGYEYFPRESLQQCQENIGCSPSGAFLAASAMGSGEKIPEEIGHSGFFDADFPIQIPASSPPAQKPNETKIRTKPKIKDDKKTMDLTRYQTLRQHLAGVKDSDLMILPDDLDKDDSSDNSIDNFDVQQNYFENFKLQDESKGEEGSLKNKKCRKSKKSLAREKLEQTFKEKGFLIQTQQLESAEGATYCKFRQLRKFTRYLFRSWKDYLPGNVRDLSIDAGVESDDLPEITGNIKTEVQETQGKPF